MSTQLGTERKANNQIIIPDTSCCSHETVICHAAVARGQAGIAHVAIATWFLLRPSDM